MGHPFNKKIQWTRIFRWTSMKHLTVFIHRIQHGVDAKGSRFPAYSKGYAELKARGFKRKDGKGLLKSMKGKSVTSRKISPPDFTLSGLTLKNPKPKEISKRGWMLQFTGQAGDIVKGNERRGRDIISSVPGKEEKFVDKLIEQKYMKIYNKKWTENINVRIGK